MLHGKLTSPDGAKDLTYVLQKATGKLAAKIKHAYAEITSTVTLFTTRIPVVLFLLLAFCPQNAAFFEIFFLFSDFFMTEKKNLPLTTTALFVRYKMVSPEAMPHSFPDLHYCNTLSN